MTGKLVVDASYFDSQRYNPGWSTGYADEYYAAPIAGLTLAPNADYDSGTIYLNYRPGSATGRKAKITTTPAAAAEYVKIVNKTVTSAPRHLDHVLRRPQARQQHDHRPRPGAEGPVDRRAG